MNHAVALSFFFIVKAAALRAEPNNNLIVGQMKSPQVARKSSQ